MSDISSVPTRLDLPPPLLPFQALTSPEVVAAVFDALADAVVVYDHAGRIVGTNPAAVNLFGLTQLGGRDGFAVPVAQRAMEVNVRTLEGVPLAPQDWPVLRVLRGEMLQGAQTMDVVVRTLDGRELIVNVSGAPLLDAEGKAMGAVCVCRDITQRVHMERDRAARAAEIESIFATQTEAVVFVDCTGRILRMNQAQRRLCTLAGFDPEAEYLQTWIQTGGQHDALGQPIQDEDRPFYRARRGETVIGEEAVELYQRSSQGQDLVLRVGAAPVRDAGGEIVGVVLTAEDVTQQRRLERELAERASQIEGIFEAMADGIVLVDATGHIVRMNESYRQLLGYDASREAAGSRFEDFAARRSPRDMENRPVPSEQLPTMRVLAGETLTGARAVEERVLTLDGRELIVQISGAPVRDAAGNLIGAVSAVRDITERRQLEEQRSDILRVVAHDLLTPITGVRLYLQTQERRVRKGQPPFMPEEGHLDTLNANLLRMERLVNDLREMTPIESGALTLERSPCDLTQLCRQEIKVQKVLMPGRTIRLVLPREPIRTEVDEQRVGQVIANLLSNALKYAPTDQPITLALGVENGMAHVAVQDKGPGIPAAELYHIWERFHRVEGISAHDGSQSLGLGLYICRAIVERHGGQVGVESTTGVGSTFWFTLPLAPTLAR